MLSLLLTTLAFAADLHLIEGTGATTAFACTAGQAVTVNGSTNTVTLTGDCGALTVNGSSNHVVADGLASVVIVGTTNDVKYVRNLSAKKKLPTTITGVANSVHK